MHKFRSDPEQMSFLHHHSNQDYGKMPLTRLCKSDFIPLMLINKLLSENQWVPPLPSKCLWYSFEYFLKWWFVGIDGRDSEQGRAPRITHRWLRLQECMWPTVESIWNSWALKHKAKFMFSMIQLSFLSVNGGWLHSLQQKKYRKN